MGEAGCRQGRERLGRRGPDGAAASPIWPRDGRVNDGSGEHSSDSPLCSTSPQRTPLQPVPAIPRPQQRPSPITPPCSSRTPTLFLHKPPPEHPSPPALPGDLGSSAATTPPRGDCHTSEPHLLSLATTDTGPDSQPPPLSSPLSRETTTPHRRVPLQGNHITQRLPRPGQQFPPRGHHQHSFSDSNSLSDSVTASASPLQGSHRPQPGQHSSCSCRRPHRLPASHCPPCCLQNSRPRVRPGTGSAQRLPCS